MPDMPIGQLVRLYRIDRRMSTTTLATHAGITARYLEMIESGTKTPSIDKLRKLAKVLRVRTSALVGEAISEDHEEGPRLAEIERALFTYPSMLPVRETDSGELSDRIEAANDAWFTSPSAYSDVLSVLPDLITDTEAFIHSSGRSREACTQGYYLYRLARAVLKHAGRIDLCTMLADRTMRYAEETEDPLIVAAATWTLGQAILSDDMPHGALDVTLSAAERLEPHLAEGAAEHFSVYGGLLQCAAVASTRSGDPYRARELLRDKARPAATRVGEGQKHHDIYFGPTNVGIHIVNVELEAGDTTEALRMADEVDISRIESNERKTAHLYHVARAYEYKGNDTAVFLHLKMAEQLRPQDFQYKQLVRTMVATLAKRAKPSYAPEIRAFANKIGLLN